MNLSVIHELGIHFDRDLLVKLEKAIKDPNVIEFLEAENVAALAKITTDLL
jgi:hypothetical protein